MTTERFWNCVTSMAAELDGGPAESEDFLDYLEDELRRHPRQRRDQMRKQLVLIVAQLARLEMRLVESDGSPPAL